MQYIYHLVLYFVTNGHRFLSLSTQLVFVLTTLAGLQTITTNFISDTKCQSKSYLNKYKYKYNENGSLFTTVSYKVVKGR